MPKENNDIGDDHMAYQFLRFPGGKAKAVTLSYDDSTKDDIRFLETINKYNLKCTFNLVSHWIGREAHTDKEFIKDNIPITISKFYEKDILSSNPSWFSFFADEGFGHATGFDRHNQGSGRFCLCQ